MHRDLSGLLETMRKHGVTQVVQASTSSCMPDFQCPSWKRSMSEHPFPLTPLPSLGAEALGYTYTHLHGFDVTVLRYFTVYGPAGRPDMAPFRFAEWCLRGEEIQLFGDGKQSRDFTYVDDIAWAPLPPFRSAFPVLKSSTLEAVESARPSLR